MINELLWNLFKLGKQYKYPVFASIFSHILSGNTTLDFNKVEPDGDFFVLFSFRDGTTQRVEYGFGTRESNFLVWDAQFGNGIPLGFKTTYSDNILALFAGKLRLQDIDDAKMKLFFALCQIAFNEPATALSTLFAQTMVGKHCLKQNHSDNNNVSFTYEINGKDLVISSDGTNLKVVFDDFFKAETALNMRLDEFAAGLEEIFTPEKTKLEDLWKL